jgi:hypothetical protein
LGFRDVQLAKPPSLDGTYIIALNKSMDGTRNYISFHLIPLINKSVSREND